MPGATKFLYGLALGVSLGIIGARLMGSASSGHDRNQRHNRRLQAMAKPRHGEGERQKAAAR